MNLEHRMILCDAAELAGKHRDNYKAIIDICRAHSDGNSDCLIGAYDYLDKHKPDDVEDLITVLKCMLRYSN